jgi:aminoglycoside phosphotransferase
VYILQPIFAHLPGKVFGSVVLAVASTEAMTDVIAQVLQTLIGDIRRPYIADYVTIDFAMEITHLCTLPEDVTRNHDAATQRSHCNSEFAATGVEPCGTLGATIDSPDMRRTMTDQIRTAIQNAITNLHADATDISIPDDLSGLNAAPSPRLSLSWKSNDELHLGHFLTWTGPSDNSHEVRMLEALSHTEAPVPELITAGTAGTTSVMLAGQVEGRTIADALENIGMRWEISAIAFTYARMLARIHSLDWTKVTPWLEDEESLPEDIIDDQIEEQFQWRASNADYVPDEWASFVQRAIDWLELRRPVEVSLCICHGQFHPCNILAVGEDVTAVVNWQQARVTDASADLAMLPVWLNEVGLSLEDAELFAQAANGAYLQSSPRGLGNTSYYSVSLPLDELINRLLDSESTASQEELERLRGTIERAMALAGRVPWKNR